MASETQNGVAQRNHGDLRPQLDAPPYLNRERAFISRIRRLFLQLIHLPLIPRRASYQARCRPSSAGNIHPKEEHTTD